MGTDTFWNNQDDIETKNLKILTKYEVINFTFQGRRQLIPKRFRLQLSWKKDGLYNSL